MSAGDPNARGAAWLDDAAARRTGGTTKRPPVLVRGDTITPVPIEWVWPGWLARGKLHLLAGRPGSGKTMLALSLAAAVTRGGRLPDGTTCPRGSVLFWSGEDDLADTLLPRFLAAGGDSSRFFAIHGPDGQPFDPSADMTALADVAAEAGDVVLMVLDPLASAVAGDSHKAGEVRRGLAPAVALAERLGCALLGVCHLAKGTNGREPLERVLGSIAFGAAARVAMLAFRETEDQGGGLLLMRMKSNISADGGGYRYATTPAPVPGHAGLEAFRVEWGEPVEGAARDVLAEAEASAEERGEREEAACWLIEELRHGPVAARELQKAAAAAGHAWATIRRAKTALGVIAEKANFSAGWRWRLPDEHPASPMQDAHHTSGERLRVI